MKAKSKLYLATIICLLLLISCHRKSTQCNLEVANTANFKICIADSDNFSQQPNQNVFILNDESLGALITHKMTHIPGRADSTSVFKSMMHALEDKSGGNIGRLKAISIDHDEGIALGVLGVVKTNELNFTYAAFCVGIENEFHIIDFVYDINPSRTHERNLDLIMEFFNENISIYPKAKDKV